MEASCPGEWNDAHRSHEHVTTELVWASLEGNDTATEMLFRRSYPKVVQLAFRLLGRREDAQDLAQDVCEVAMRKLRDLKDPSAFDAWVLRICTLKARSKIRQYSLLKRLRLTGSRPVDIESLVSESAGSEVRMELQHLYVQLEVMKPDERIALVLHRIEEMTHEEIAVQMGVSVSTVKRRIADAAVTLERLRP